MPQTRDRRSTDKEILAQLANITAVLETMHQTEAARRERELHLTEIVTKDHETINGNGKPGLKTEVQLLKDSMGRINWAFGIFTAAIIADIASRLVK